MTNRFYCGVFHRFSRDVKFLSIKPGIASSHCNYSPKLAILQNTVSVKHIDEFILNIQKNYH